MVHDCFMFWKELDMLELRLRHMFDVVDRFVIVEANRTFRGEDKPLHFWENRSRFGWAMPKIDHVVVNLPEYHAEYWGMEGTQRNGIFSGVSGAGMDDFVYISDVDELPRLDKLEEAHQACLRGGPTALVFTKHHWKLNNRMDTSLPGSEFHEPWAAFAVCLRRHLKADPNSGSGMTPQQVRDARLALPRVEAAGWHFSFIGDEWFNKEKIQAFSHTEYDTPDFTDPERIKERISKLDVDPFERGFRYRVEPIERGNYPDYIIDNLDKYREMGWVADWQ